MLNFTKKLGISKRGLTILHIITSPSLIERGLLFNQSFYIFIYFSFIKLLMGSHSLLFIYKERGNFRGLVTGESIYTRRDRLGSGMDL